MSDLNYARRKQDEDDRYGTREGAREAARFRAGNTRRETMHTPGPWTAQLARFAGGPPFGFSIHADGKVPYVASAGVSEPNHHLIVAEHFRKLVTTGYTEEEVEANARLIAEAPELLKVLKHLVRYHDQLSTQDIAIARAAIAKATQ